MPKRFSVVPTPEFSDGDPATHPAWVVPAGESETTGVDPVTLQRPYELPSQTSLENWLSKTADCLKRLYVKDPLSCPGVTKEGETVEFANFATCSDFPKGYALLFLQRGTQGKKASDPYLFGHPGGLKFRSAPEWIPHLEWLVTDKSHDHKNCLCRLCPAWARKKLAGAHLTFTQHRRRTVDPSSHKLPVTPRRKLIPKALSAKQIRNNETIIILDDSPSPTIPSKQPTLSSNVTANMLQLPSDSIVIPLLNDAVSSANTIAHSSPSKARKRSSDAALNETNHLAKKGRPDTTAAATPQFNPPISTTTLSSQPSVTPKVGAMPSAHSANAITATPQCNPSISATTLSSQPVVTPKVGTMPPSAQSASATAFTPQFNPPLSATTLSSQPIVTPTVVAMPSAQSANVTVISKNGDRTSTPAPPAVRQPVFPMYRVGDVVWIQVYLALLWQPSNIIRFSTLQNPANAVDIGPLCDNIAYWPAIVKSAHTRKSPNSVKTFANIWVPPLFQKTGSTRGTVPQFAPSHQFRNVGPETEWDGHGYIVHLVDAPVEFTILEEFIRPFAGYILPRTLRMDPKTFDAFANATPDTALTSYLRIVNKVYEYARSVVCISGSAPKILPAPTTNSAVARGQAIPPGQPSWESVQVGAENIRVHDIIRGNVTPVSAAQQQVCMLQVDQITWQRGTPVQFVCHPVQFYVANLPNDAEDPTLSMKRGRLHVIRRKGTNKHVTLGVEQIVGRYYPKLDGIDGWVGPRHPVDVRQQPCGLVPFLDGPSQ